MIELLIALIIVGAILYILQLLPIDSTFKRIAYVIIVVFFVIYLLRHLGSFGL
jgi:hypothetical protein